MDVKQHFNHMVQDWMMGRGRVGGGGGVRAITRKGDGSMCVGLCVCSRGGRGGGGVVCV